MNAAALALLAACVALGAASAAPAQDESEDVVQNPAVLVTGAGLAAQSPGETLVDVRPQREAPQTAWDALNAAVPDFHASESGSGGYGGLFAARGLANTPYFGDPSVTVYFADIPLPSSFTYPEGLFDFSSAAVFMGPRGTEFGRATDGAVVVLDPAEEARAGGELLAAAGSYDLRQVALLAGSDPRAGADAEVVADYDARDGYVWNRQLGIGVGGQEDENAFVRLRVRPAPADELAVEVLETRSRDGAQPLVPLGGPLYDVSRAMEGVTDLDSVGVALKGTFGLPGAGTLSSVTSYTDWQMNPYQSFLVIPPPLTNAVLQDQKRWSEELRLRNGPKSAVRAQAGAWLSRGTTGNFVDRAIPGLFPVEVSSFAQAEAEAAAFGQATIEPLAGLSVTAGLRAEAGQKSFNRLEDVPVAGLAYGTSERYGALLPRLSASWQISPDGHLEASVAEGLRPGGFSSFTDNPALMPFAPERSTEYSAGWVQSNSSQSASLSLAAFYASIDNLQIERSFSATDYFVASAPRAHSLGLEAQASWKPSGQWTLQLAAGWTRVVLDEFSDPLTGADESGHEAPDAPSYNASLGAVFRPSARWFFAARATAVGRTYFDEVGTPLYTQDAYCVLGLRVGYVVGPWTLLAYGDNLGKAGYYDLIVPGVNSGAPGAPRTFGAKATLRF